MARKNRMTLHSWHGYTVLDLGDMDIWDGADLALLRDTLAQVIVHEGCRRVGVNMRYVKYIPSGFFGMLYDWLERGVSIRLYRPQPNVANMLWFRKFFEHLGEGCFRLLSEPKANAYAPEEDWSEYSWDYDDEESSVAAVTRD